MIEKIIAIKTVFISIKEMELISNIICMYQHVHGLDVVQYGAETLGRLLSWSHLEQ